MRVSRPISYMFVVILFVAGISGLWLVGHTISRKAFGYEVPVTDAARSRNWDEVKSLLRQGADPNETTDLQNNHTALYWALADNRADVITALIQAHVRVKQHDTKGVETPEWRSQHPDLAHLLDEARH